MLKWFILDSYGYLIMSRRALLSLCSGLIILFCATCSQADTLLEDINGSTIPFSTLKGKWVFINYWASWCSPCVDEIAELNQFYDEHKSGNLAVFAVNYDTLPLYKQQRLTRKFDIHYPSLKLQSVNQLHLGDISVVPITFVFNPEGKLTTALYGGQTLESLNDVMASVTAQAQPLKQHA